MDRNQSGWNITAFNRPNTTDRYTRSSPDEVRGYEKLAGWGAKLLQSSGEDDWSGGQYGSGANALYEQAQDESVVLPSGTYSWGEYGQWIITIDYHRQVRESALPALRAVARAASCELRAASCELRATRRQLHMMRSASNNNRWLAGWLAG
jgi:hypothetical protein